MGARLAEQVRVAGNGKLWFWWSGEPVCPADDVDTTADKITHVLAPWNDPDVMRIRTRAGA